MAVAPHLHQRPRTARAHTEPGKRKRKVLLEFLAMDLRAFRAPALPSMACYFSPRHLLSSVTDVKTKMNESHTARKPPAPPDPRQWKTHLAYRAATFPYLRQSRMPSVFLRSMPPGSDSSDRKRKSFDQGQHEGSTARGVLLVIKLILAVVMSIERIRRWTSGLSHHGSPS